MKAGCAAALSLGMGMMAACGMASEEVLAKKSAGVMTNGVQLNGAQLNGVQLNGLHTVLVPVEKCPDPGLGERLGNEFLLPLYGLQEQRLAEHIPIRS
jgi:hypothetical protein